MINDKNEHISLATERTLLANERNRLANERTFLAWVRTGLASVGGGVAIIRLLTFENYGHQVMSQMIGCSLVILGIAIFVLSYFDYKNSYRKLKVKNGYAGSMLVITVITIVLSIISTVLLLIAFRLGEINI